MARGCIATRPATIRPASDRPLEQLKLGDWEVRDDGGEPLTPVPTPEDKTPALASVYALSKFDQERMCLMVGARLRHPGRGSAVLQYLRTLSGAVESLHRSAQ